MQADSHSLRSGIAWMLLAALFFTAESVIIKQLSDAWPAPLLLFWRQAAAVALLLPLIIARGPVLWKVASPKLVIIRSATGTLALLCSIYAIASLPLATANALSFTRPLMLAVLAALFLGEKLRRLGLFALGSGMTGVVIMLGPDAADLKLDLAFAAALAAALLFAASLLSIKMMAADHQPTTLLVYGVVLGLVMVLPFAATDWRWPDRADVWLLIAIGGVSLGTVFCTIRALGAAQASVVAQFDYMRLPLAVLAGAVFFAEQLDWSTILGAVFIIAGAWIASRRSKVMDTPGPATALSVDSRPLLRDALSVQDIKAFYEAQVAEQQAIAVAHMGDSYWTDSRTGHNVGRDELTATRLMLSIQTEPTAWEHDDPARYAECLLNKLNDLSHTFRADQPDPDGYGIATIGTVARNLKVFAYGK